MLAYRHLFHAGGYADVFKHALLAQLVLCLKAKVKPFLYLDTHAGAGLYDLAHPWARKNREYLGGIARIRERADAPPALAPYLHAVHTANPDGRLRRYPGSPLIVRALIRGNDRMALTELNRTDCESLAALFSGDRRVQVRLMDGFDALKAFLPPRERRGLVLIDSSFDRAREFDRVKRAFAQAHRRFATGVHALWYPHIGEPVIAALERGIAATGMRKVLQLDLAVRARHTGAGLAGCGMLIANPPFGFEATARSLLQWLWPALSPEGEGSWRARWLVPE
ncbi:MAG: 23S rRNA (adenine(2030)-N(6))-methyltransferase RlmJ [Burkholderiales bacterium]|nr:23S rRNA (adenine(2030)-N(6))-methyltransferase RlmJ [Burkholderiales bacterium]